VVWQEPPPLGGATREAAGAAGAVVGLQKAMVCRNVGLALPENLPDTVRKYVDERTPKRERERESVCSGIGRVTVRGRVSW
jgi:hypothetical protein